MRSETSYSVDGWSGTRAGSSRDREFRRLVSDGALAQTPLLARLLEKGGTGRVLEHLTDALIRLGRAFKVLECVDFSGDSLTLKWHNVRRCALCVFSERCMEQDHQNKPSKLARTCSGLTGVCEVLASSSITLLS